MAVELGIKPSVLFSTSRNTCTEKFQKLALKVWLDSLLHLLEFPSKHF